MESDTNLEHDLHPTRNADGSYTYYDIGGQDWTIDFRVEELVHDGVINHYALREAMGYGHEPKIHTDMDVIAYGLGFVGENLEFGTIDVIGKINDSEWSDIELFWEGPYHNRIYMDSDGDMVPAALEQLVVAIAGCEQYKEAQVNGQIAPSPYEGKLGDEYIRRHNGSYYRYGLR